MRWNRLRVGKAPEATIASYSLHGHPIERRRIQPGAAAGGVDVIVDMGSIRSSIGAPLTLRCHSATTFALSEDGTTSRAIILATPGQDRYPTR